MAIADVGGRKLYYELIARLPQDESEPIPISEPPPLVLLNGIGGSCRGWLPLQVPEFSKTRSLLLLDHRGVGESSDTGKPFTTADLAEDVADVLDQLEIERADVLGAFMGGMIAQELALRHPRLVHKLVLVGCYVRPDAKRRMLLEDWAALATSGVPSETLQRNRLVWTLHEETLEQTDLIETMLDFFLKQDQPVGSELFARQCQACILHDTTGRLHDIQCPTMIVCGRQDQLTPPKLHRELADAIPGSRYVVIDFGAHLVMVESVVRFNELVRHFLDEPV